MGQLLFRKPLQEAIRRGRKRTTIRRWPAGKPTPHVGQRVYSPGLGWLAIDAVEPVDLEALGDADARADGFDTAAGLRDVLLALYPRHAADGKRWFRVRFRVAALAPARTSGPVPKPVRVRRRRGPPAQPSRAVLALFLAGLF